MNLTVRGRYDADIHRQYAKNPEKFPKILDSSDIVAEY